VYATARKFFGEPAGFISLCLATFCPPLLAHSHLVHTDAAMTALLFLTLLAFMKMAESWSIKWSVGCGLLLGASLAAKFSAVLLLPIALLIGLARVLGDRVPGGLRSGWSRLRPSAAMAWGCALALLVAYVEIWAWYGFRYGCSPDGSFTLAWQFDKLAATPAGRLLKLAYDHHLLPQAYAYGLAHVASHSEEGHSAYALGQYSNTGWWWYFPFAFLVKTPAPTLIVIGWGLYAVWRRALSGPVKEVPLLLALLVYGVSAMSSNINIGIRHILPAYPLLLTLAGGAVQAVDRTTSSWRWTRRAALALTATTALGCLAGAPYFLADFNLPSTLVLQRHEMLGDSNLDWGQDLGRLKRYLDRHHIGSIKLAYCGVASPRHLGLRHDVLPAGNIYSQQEREWRKTSEIVPGDLVAVSATCLVGIVAEDKNYYLRVFKDLKPEATIGHSIFLYRIPDRDRRGD
jgi:4-amino-4-deoxy-L-arabinose transferase-like glycosyltransferase